jgi:VWFA-related protein
MQRPLISKPSIPSLLLLLAFLPTAASFAVPPDPVQQQPPAQEPDLQRPVFGATVSRVRVDVVVTDSDGNFVDDLSPEDFLLFDDGVEQSVLSMQLVDLRAGVVTDLITGAPVGGERQPEPAAEAPAEKPAAPSQPDFFGQPAAAETAEGATAEGEAGTSPPLAMEDNPAGELGAIIFLIDGTSISTGARRKFTDAWADVLDQTEDLNAPRAVYLIENNGHIEEIVPLTFDLEPLRQAGEIIRDSPTYGTDINSRMIELTREMEYEVPDFDRKVRRYEFEERMRSINTLDTLTNFCDALMSRSGRTALVWVSTGIKLTYGGPYAALLAGMAAADRDETFFAVDPYAEVVAEEDEVEQGGEGEIDPYADVEFIWFNEDPDLQARQDRLEEAANSANVSIYSIDPTPVSEVRGIGYDPTARTSNSSHILQELDVQGSLDALRDSMRSASQETGGEAMINWGDLSIALKRVEEDSGRFYLLTYSTPPPLGDGQYHAIEVEVKRPDLNVRERTGYVDLAPIERRTKSIAAALMLPGTVTAEPLGVKAFHMWSGTGQPVIDLAVAVETEADVWRSPEARITKPWKELHVMALDGGGEIVDEFHIEVQPPSPVLPGEGPAEPGAEPDTTEEAAPPALRPYVYAHTWELAPGTYDVRVVVKDELSGELGARRLDMTVEGPSAAPEEWRTSDLMLTVTDGVSPAQPLIDNEVIYGERLEIYVEVAGGIEPSISGSIFGAYSDDALADLPELALPVDAVGIHRGALWLEGIPPGEYELAIRVADTAAGQEREFRVPLTAVPPSVAARQ